MAVVNNTASEPGDTLIMHMETPVTGISGILGFSDLIFGQNLNRIWDRYFTYSIDGGISYNPEGYIQLTQVNLNAVSIDETHDLLVSFKYVRIGSDTAGLLTWDGTTLITNSSIYESGEVYAKSVFSKFYPSNYHPSILKWSLNVDKKIYGPGIIPLYVVRGDNENINDEDRDYIDFWRALTHYFALLVCYARVFENYRDDRELLIDFLRQRGVFLCDEMTIIDLQYIQENYWDEMRHRGTNMITQPKGTIINGKPKAVDGELLRMICYNHVCDEFLFSISESTNIGWVIGQWSPLWRGTTHSWQLNKMYEKGPHLQLLSNYPTNINPSGFVNGNLDFTISATEPVIRIGSVPSNEEAGIGTPNGTFDSQYAVNIDPDLTYELDFQIRYQGPDSAALKVGLFGFSSVGTPIQFGDSSIVGFPDKNFALEDVEFFDDGNYYNVKVILYKIGSVHTSDHEFTTTNLNIGNNLVIKDSGVCKILPYIALHNNGTGISGSFNIYNLSFKPAHTEYSTGFLNTANFVQSWMKNNQGSFTQSQLENLIKFYLIPYKSTLQINFL